MHRRRFLGQVAGVSAAMASSSFLAAGPASRVAAAPGHHPPPPASIQYLTCDHRFEDARPCFDPTGTLVLFMRTPLKEPSQTWLYTIPAASASRNPHHCQQPDPFFVDPDLPATRPDWSWSRTSFEIAFAGNSRLHLLNTKTRKSLFVDCQPSGSIVLDTLSYPSWTADGSAIVLTNYSESALAHQQLLRVLVPATPPVPFSAVCTAVTDPSQVWPGMSSVSPSDPNLVAFAGQAPNFAQTYDQNWNQIWIQSGAAAPLEIDGIQGRAPWWSPSGTLIAFESILTPTDGFNPFFRIWVLPVTINPPSIGIAQMVTPADLAVQHAKWSPDGTRIVFAYVIPGGKPVSTKTGGVPPQGIAIVDLPQAV